MRRMLAATFCLMLAAPPAHADAVHAGDSVVGRWDIELRSPAGMRPAWLEVRRSGRTLVGQFVGVVGSARPVSRIDFDKGALRFSLPPQWERGDGDLSFEGRLQGDTLSGTAMTPDGARVAWSARRAPSLRREAGAPRWGKPIQLFDGSSLAGWRELGGEPKWKAIDGVLRTVGNGANLATDRTFEDFRLQLEFRLPRGSNSGVYLRGRYEVQVADEAREPAVDTFGAIYGFIAPSDDVSRGADTWQSLDITLVGRRVTVVANGKTIVCDREIPGITGGAIDSDEGAPGPILLQGDHGPVEYRRIVLTPRD